MGDGSPHRERIAGGRQAIGNLTDKKEDPILGQLRIPPLARHRMAGTLLVFGIQEDVGIHEDHR
jgi:hypothetical protein